MASKERLLICTQTLLEQKKYNLLPEKKKLRAKNIQLYFGVSRADVEATDASSQTSFVTEIQHPAQTASLELANIQVVFVAQTE